jgi:hypothetical protein
MPSFGNFAGDSLYTVISFGAYQVQVYEEGIEENGVTILDSGIIAASA